MSDLVLQTQAERHFDFLASERGFTRTESNPYLVRYESPEETIEVVFDGNSSYELGLLVARKGMEGPPFTIDEILRLRQAPEADSFALIQVSTREALAEWVAKLADALRTHGDDFIEGREESFQQVAAQRHREVQAYALERKLRAARAEAETAWHRKGLRWSDRRVRANSGVAFAGGTCQAQVRRRASRAVTRMLRRD